MPDYRRIYNALLSKDGLAAQVVHQIGPQVVPGQPYALVDYPLYNNPGDAAIWMGARLMLNTIMAGPPAHVSTLGGFDPKACRHAIGDGMVFVLGGGNFGSLYPRHHDHKLRLIRRMPDNPILHLPFSIAGADPRVLAETAQVIARHGQVHLFAREGKSRALIADLMGLTVPLAPDTAHVLEPGPRIARCDETRLFRRDREARDWRPDKGQSWDWGDLFRLRLVNRIGKLAHHLTRGDRQARVMDRLAALRVEIAFDRLGQGRHVVTDRLHAMILAGLLGRTVTAHDNATGKLRAYVESWGAGLDGVTLAPPPDPTRPSTATAVAS